MDFNHDSEVFKAWVGAWLDTEGSIMIGYKDKLKRVHTLKLSIGQKEVKPLKIIQEGYGGRIYRSKKRWGEREHLIYELQMCRRVALTLLIDVLPYLVVKKDQAEKAIEFYDLLRSPIGNRGKPITDKEWKKREEYRNQINKSSQLKLAHSP